MASPAKECLLRGHSPPLAGGLGGRPFEAAKIQSAGVGEYPGGSARSPGLQRGPLPAPSRTTHTGEGSAQRHYGWWCRARSAFRR
jgi:hypothetical protein